MPINTSYLGRKPGKFKLTSVGLGLSAVIFASIAYDNQGLACTTSHFCRPEANIFHCVHNWLPKLGLAFIIMAWLFSCAMLMGSLMPDCSMHPNFPKVDVTGHVVFGVVQIFSFLLVILWLLNLLIVENCFASENTSKDCLKNTFLQSEGILWLIGAILALFHATILLILYTNMLIRKRSRTARTARSSRRPSLDETIETQDPDEESAIISTEEYRREHRHKSKRKHRDRDRDY